MKKALIAFLVVLSIPVIFVTIVSLPWLLMLVCSVFEPNPPVPEITSGEFPFCLEYRIGDETFIVEDVVMCEYDGIGFGDNGKFLKWKKWVASTGEEDLLLLTEENKKIFCTVGKADYYMGKTQEKELPKPKIYMEKQENSITISSADPAELAKYDIEIIDYEFSQPIENQFK